MTLPIRQPTMPAGIEWYPNGKLSASQLVTTPGQAGGADVRLLAPAARAWKALVAAAARDGHVLKVATPDRSYRPYASQEAIFRARYTPHRTPGYGRRYWQRRWWSKKPGVAAAAKPGTSNHGWGIAVDVGEESDGDTGTESLDAGTLTWLKIHAHRFGWSWELQSEPWHLRYWAGDAIPESVLEHESRHAQGGQPMLIQYGFFTYLNEGWRYRFLASPSSVKQFRDAGLPVVNLSNENAATWRALREEAIADGRLVGEPEEVASTYP